MTKSSTGLDENIAALLCYVLGWLSGLLFLVAEKDSEYVKFHARQSIALFGLLTVASIVVPAIPLLGGLLATLIGAGTFFAWLAMMIFAVQGKQVEVPFVIDIANAIKDE